jgi:hypothetical protein
MARTWTSAQRKAQSERMKGRHGKRKYAKPVQVAAGLNENYGMEMPTAKTSGYEPPQLINYKGYVYQLRTDIRLVND